MLPFLIIPPLLITRGSTRSYRFFLGLAYALLIIALINFVLALAGAVPLSKTVAAVTCGLAGIAVSLVRSISYHMVVRFCEVKRELIEEAKERA